MTDQPYIPWSDDDPAELSEPYPFSTILQLKPDGNHELLTAVVFSGDPPRCSNGYRYTCLFPANGRVLTAKVYSDEIESVIGMDLNGEYLCSGCLDETRNRCFSRGITPATCC